MRKLKNSELNRINVNEFKNAKKNPIVIVLDNIRSLNNIGSVFRTSDAFRIEGIHLCGITATPPHRDIQKTALGATKSVDWKYFSSTIESINYLKKNNYKIYAVEQVDKSIMLNDFKPDIDDKLAFIFGNEVNGVEDSVIDIVDNCIEIPQYGTKHSFNISVSVGIVLWDAFLKLKRK
ncbi:MAG: RNA methyltransferase [Bacteroidales bacterium]|nr:RNA methyltransferase [Bacteroidales bacterium]